MKTLLNGVLELITSGAVSGWIIRRIAMAISSGLLLLSSSLAEVKVPNMEWVNDTATFVFSVITSLLLLLSSYLSGKEKK